MADKDLKIRGYFGEVENATWRANWVAGGLGFEPRQAESESAVLPLDDPPEPGVRRFDLTPWDRPFRLAARRFQGLKARPTGEAGPGFFLGVDTGSACQQAGQSS